MRYVRKRVMSLVAAVLCVAFASVPTNAPKGFCAVTEIGNMWVGVVLDRWATGGFPDGSMVRFRGLETTCELNGHLF